LDDVLIRPAHSLTKQVHSNYLPHLFVHTATREGDKAERANIASHNKFVNSDGTGVVFYTSSQADYGEAEGLRPQQYRTTQPPLNDPNFTSLCTHSASTCVFAHIRMATSVVQPFNNHPFVFGRHSFMHNGGIASFPGAVRLGMVTIMSQKAHEAVLGSTDSEHLAGLYMTFLAPNDDWEKTYPLAEMRAALEKAIQTTIDIQRKAGITDASSLNCCATDGTQLVAVRFRNVVGDDQPPSLYVSTKAGPTLSRKYEGHPDEVNGVHAITQAEVKPEGAKAGQEGPKGCMVPDKPAEHHGKHVIVASEPTTFNQDEWDLVNKNEIVLVAPDMSVTREAANIKF